MYCTVKASGGGGGGGGGNVGVASWGALVHQIFPEK